MKPDPRHHLVKAIEAIAERMLDSPRAADHTAARQIHAEVNRLRLSAEALDNRRRNRSPLDTDAAHALKIAKLARAFSSEVTASLNRAAAAWASARQDAERRIAEKLNLVPNADAREIRDVYRAMSSKAQAAFLKKMIDENRGPALAAIIKVDGVLTGLSDAQRAHYEEAMVATYAESDLGEQAMLDDVFDAFNAAQKAAGSIAKDLTDPARISEIERADAEATAAEEAFNQSLQ